MLGPHKNLLVWQKSIAFATALYEHTNHFPQSETYGLVNQMRRASVSISSNIAEGYGRNSINDLVHFLHMALGSSNEIDAQLIISFNLGYLNKEEFDELDGMNEAINKMIRSLIYIKLHPDSTQQP